MSSPPPRRLRRGLLVALAALLLLAGGAVAFVMVNKPGDVSNPDVEFTTDATSTPAPAPERPQAVDAFLWPTYGYTANRTRDYGTAPDYLRPPFRRGWTYRSGILLEFPPAIEGASLYLLDDDGMLRAIQKTSGRILWRQRVGRLAAASPAVGDGRVYAVVLRGLGSETGRIAAYRAADGRQVWSKALPSRAESSPLLRNGRVFFGTEDGTVYAVQARNGRTIWTYQADGAVKGGPALENGTLYFGDYAGKVHAVRARDGRGVWSVGTSGTRFGFGSGRFYSTAAVAFGRVYLGNTDSRVYSFSARTGELAWATGTGGYVYASPAVANTPGIGPTVYIGSYDGNFYAFDARSGAERWRYGVGNRISGSATIVGNVVYFSNLGSDETHGVNARSGRRAFYFSDGAFNPVVADRRAIYLAGYTNIYELLPRRSGPRWRRAQEAAVRAAREQSPEALRAARAQRSRR
jgi:outer membrane protein assembly factor BamB